MTPNSWEAKWVIEKELGRGGQGKTSLVTSKDDTSQRGVLKTLNRGKSVQARGRMHREVVALDTLAKANVKVPQVLDDHTSMYADENVPLYFVMEYIPGKTLKAEIAERGGLPLDKAAALVMDLCRTVAAAHENDVLHRDLKPDNVVVRNFDASDLVIVDYGLSYMEDSTQDLTHVDEQFRNRFLSLPETNTQGSDRRDKRSDITALCAVLCYCITGIEPGHLRYGDGRPPHRRVNNSVRQALQGDSRCEQLEAFFERAFAPEVENRFQSCEEVMTRLLAVLKPPPLDEDPAVVSAELAKLLRQDRKTLLAEYTQHSQPTLQKMQELASQVAGRITPPFQLTLSVAPTWVFSTFPGGTDKLSEYGVSLNMVVGQHSFSRSIILAAGAKGNQCVLMRGVIREDQPRRQTHVPSVQWEELIWFDPNSLPKDDQLLRILNQSVNNMMRELAGQVLPS